MVCVVYCHKSTADLGFKGDHVVKSMVVSPPVDTAVCMVSC